MLCPNEVNPPTWQRFAAWQVKWKGKSNHVRTCAQWADYGEIMRTGALWPSMDTVSTCLLLLLDFHPHKATPNVRLMMKKQSSTSVDPMTASRHERWQTLYSMRRQLFKKGNEMWGRVKLSCCEFMRASVFHHLSGYHYNGMHESGFQKLLLQPFPLSFKVAKEV